MLTYGIDLSHHQDPKAVPWERIAKECAFVICRATYGTMRDRQVVEHVKRARGAGVAVGLYHFFRFIQKLDDQLAVFSAAAEAAGYAPGDIAPALDIEDDPKVCEVARGWDSSVHSLAIAFEERYGERPLIYITQRDWHRLGEPAWVLDYPLWVAHYTQAKAPATPNRKPWLIWQNRVGPFEPTGLGGLHQPALFDQNLCCGPLPRATRVSSDVKEAVSKVAAYEPSWEELRNRVETTQALMLDPLWAASDSTKEPNT